MQHNHFDEAIKEDINQIERTEIQLLLEGLYQVYGYDFRDYMLSSIRRRIWYRVQAERLHTISQLQDRVLHNHDCMVRLLSDFLIQVTEMFRDPGFYKSLREKVIPQLQAKSRIKIWHAGCSTGEEVYSTAILLQEAGLYDRALIYATDISEKAINKAKSGRFPLSVMKLYTNNYLQMGGQENFSQYYAVSGAEVFLNASLKKNLVFGRHNLVTDSSFNEFDLIFCRNVLIYFNRSLQNRVHNLFYESLYPHGFLALGQKETIKFTAFADLYQEIDGTYKIYKKRNQ